MIWFFIVGGFFALILALVVWMVIVGKGMPPEHRLTCTISLTTPTIEQVYDAVRDVERWPEWAGVDRVEILKPGGEPQWRMFMGRNRMLCVTRAQRPPVSLEIHVEDERMKIFTGIWRYRFVPQESGAGVRVELVEDGTIHAALPRYMARRLSDPAMYMKRHLRHLAKRFGEEAKIVEG
jgi:hypothetical protein